MDKRLPLVLLICLVIMIGWSVLFPPRPSPAKPASAAAETALAKDAASRADAPAAELPPAPPERSPRGADTEARELAMTVGKPGTPGYYRALFTNRGAGLLELKSGNYFDRARLTDEEKERVEHWTTMVGAAPANAPDRVAMSMRTSPSSRALEREPLDRELWTMTPIGTADAPEGVEFRLAPGTGVVFTKRFRFVPGEDRLRVELEIENVALDGEAGVRQF